MSDQNSNNETQGEVETALLDAELFVKYHAPERAINGLRIAVERSPRSVRLRQRLRELAASNKQPDEAARQCLALASIYIERDDFDKAQDSLLEAKQFDPRINIASGLEAIRRARKLDTSRLPDASARSRAARTLAGDISVISLFDVVQVLENARLTGALSIISEALSGSIQFNEGRIVGAESDEFKGANAFQRIVQVNSGTFDFERSSQPFPITIQASSNTKLILDTLRHLDENRR